MSTSSLRAPENHASLKSPHLPNIPSSRPYWDQQNDMSNLYFSFDENSMEQNLKTHQQDFGSVYTERKMSGSYCSQSPAPQCQSLKTCSPTHVFLSSYTEHSMHIPPEGDQVVPSFQKLSVYEHMPPCSPRRCTKPLPPLPDLDDMSSDDVVDSEVEFFTSTDDTERLVPERCSKPFAFCYGVPGRRSFRGCGQVNYAYSESTSGFRSQGQQVQQREQVTHRDGVRQQDRPQRRLRRSLSGPAGSFKPANLRLMGHHQNHSHPQEKPEIPPRVPIPPRPSRNTDTQRWSADMQSSLIDVDKPPKVPPREPIPCSSPRASSPKSLPIYVNGVMPPTQSFAPNPQYVSKAQQRQSCEGLPNSRSPCIVPVLENGKKASATHYYLLPHRPDYLDKFERFFREQDSEAANDGYKSGWHC